MFYIYFLSSVKFRLRDLTVTFLGFCEFIDNFFSKAPVILLV